MPASTWWRATAAAATSAWPRFGQLEYLRFDKRFDLVVCTDVLHYLKPAEIRAGLQGIVDMLEGIAFLEVFTRRDDPAGDMQGFVARTPQWYLREFQACRPAAVRLALLSGAAAGAACRGAGAGAGGAMNPDFPTERGGAWILPG